LKSLVAFFACLLTESGKRCGTSTLRDEAYARRRIEHEGLEFLTLTLPAFGKDFERSLDQGRIGSGLFKPFRRRGGLPCFLSGFLCQVFDRSSGCILDCPSVDAIKEIRQLTLLFSKICLPCSSERVEAAFTAYVECDEEVRQHEKGIPEELLAEFSRAALLAFGGAFVHADALVHRMDLRPRHGPGSVADHTSSNARWDRLVWTDRLERIIPAGEFLIPNWRYLERHDSISLLGPDQEPPVRVVSVSKTLKAPRIIAIEPVHTQYAQQALLDVFVRSIQADDNARVFLDFSSAEPNRSMARYGSSQGHLATLDLSEASDRVSLRLVGAMFDRFPWIREALLASRSMAAEVPGHGVIPLAKFASMGSSTCFPVESFVFATIALMGFAESHGTRLTPALVREAVGQVRVYGDDIIVPVHSVPSVIGMLEAFGLKVNTDKSFWTGRFRESCGGDYYDGHDVSIVKVRAVFPRNRGDAEEIVSTIALRNLLWEEGYWDSVSFIDRMIMKLGLPYPRVVRGSSLLGRWDFDCESESWDDELHVPLVRVMALVANSPSDPLDGEGALVKWFVLKRGLPLSADHLSNAGRPRSVRIKPRWMNALL